MNVILVYDDNKGHSFMMSGLFSIGWYLVSGFKVFLEFYFVRKAMCYR